VLHGRDRRFVVVVGPCSIHDPSSALEYAERLVPVAERAADRLIVVMRTYFEKPRTTVGWKGFLHDPALDGRCDLASGIESARALLVELAEVGVACGGEALDPVTPQYLRARATESSRAVSRFPSVSRIRPRAMWRSP
jgi:3-deoxy-7-phosphoheptulonate synthase